MEDRRVVAELKVAGVHRPAFPLGGEDLGLAGHLGDEHRALAGRSGGEEVEVLPQGASDRRGDAHVVLQPGEPIGNRGVDQVGMNDGATLGADLSPLLEDLDFARLVADHQAAESLVADQDVGPETQEEEGNVQPAGGEDGRRELVRAPRFVEEVGRSADVEGRLGSQDLALADAVEPQGVLQRLEPHEAGGEGSSIIWMRRTWRPPSKGVSSQICTSVRAISSEIIRWPKEITLASLCWRPKRADSSFQHRAQRTPRTRLATIASPLPEPPSTMPRSTSPAATASATGRMKAG